MSWLILSSVLFFITGEILFVYSAFKDIKWMGYLGGGIVVYFVIFAATYRPFPKAIDVYQGKTDIEYIYKDGRVVDSVVVFKNVKYVR